MWLTESQLLQLLLLPHRVHNIRKLNSGARTQDRNHGIWYLNCQPKAHSYKHMFIWPNELQLLGKQSTVIVYKDGMSRQQEKQLEFSLIMSTVPGHLHSAVPPSVVCREKQKASICDGGHQLLPNPLPIVSQHHLNIVSQTTLQLDVVSCACVCVCVQWKSCPSYPSSNVNPPLRSLSPHWLQADHHHNPGDHVRQCHST